MLLIPPLILADLFFDKLNSIDLSYTIFHVEPNIINKITNKEELSIEAIYWNVFGVLTPQNSYLSRKLNKLLNDLHANKISIESFLEVLDRFEEASIDRNQMETLNLVKTHAIENWG